VRKHRPCRLRTSCTAREELVCCNVPHHHSCRVSSFAVRLARTTFRIPPPAPIRSTRNPNKCTPYLRAISTKIEIISTTRGGTSQNSTDLDSGRRPKLKSEEFFEVPPLVVEIRYEVVILELFPKKGYTRWRVGAPFDSGIDVAGKGSAGVASSENASLPMPLQSAACATRARTSARQLGSFTISSRIVMQP